SPERAALAHQGPECGLFEPDIHRAEQGSGLKRDPSGSFLKCEVVTNGPARYCGSFTSVVTLIHVSPVGVVTRSNHSVRIVSALYGTPFLRTYPAFMRVVTTFKLPLRGCPAARSHSAAE